METKIGLLAELTKKQTNRDYFSSLPVGTKFIIVEEIKLPAYDLTGYFINVKPQIIKGKSYHLGYIEKGTWKIIGDIRENINNFL